MDSNFTIRTLTPKDYKTLADLSHKEGWNVSEQDARPFLAVDPRGYFIGELNGEPIATISAVKFGSYAQISLYIVKEGYRGKGYGIKIFQHAMEYVKDAQVVGLDSVEPQVHTYEKWGFKVHMKGEMLIRKARGRFIA